VAIGHLGGSLEEGRAAKKHKKEKDFYKESLFFAFFFGSSS
jgi:hypothetical protein